MSGTRFRLITAFAGYGRNRELLNGRNSHEVLACLRTASRRIAAFISRLRPVIRRPTGPLFAFVRQNPPGVIGDYERPFAFPNVSEVFFSVAIAVQDTNDLFEAESLG